jgi:hypothetical protein
VRSLESAVLETSFLPENRSFYQKSLSVITVDLPSEKNSNPARTSLAGLKCPASLIRGAFRSRKNAVNRRPRAVPFHPKFTLYRA